jgi:hypothetical protein
LVARLLWEQEVPGQVRVPRYLERICHGRVCPGVGAPALQRLPVLAGRARRRAQPGEVEVWRVERSTRRELVEPSQFREGEDLHSTSSASGRGRPPAPPHLDWDNARMGSPPLLGAPVTSGVRRAPAEPLPVAGFGRYVPCLESLLPAARTPPRCTTCTTDPRLASTRPPRRDHRDHRGLRRQLPVEQGDANRG